MYVFAGPIRLIYLQKQQQQTKKIWTQENMNLVGTEKKKEENTLKSNFQLDCICSTWEQISVLV